MAKKLEFFYDCSSPWTYLAFSRIEDVAHRQDGRVLLQRALTASNDVVDGEHHAVMLRPLRARTYQRPGTSRQRTCRR